MNIISRFVSSLEVSVSASKLHAKSYRDTSMGVTYSVLPDYIDRIWEIC